MNNRNYYYYINIIRLNLIEKFNIEDSNIGLPNINNVVLTGTIKKTTANFEARLKNIIYALEILFGQKPQLIQARKSVAAFQVRKGSIGAWKLTLRKGLIFDFLDKLVIDALPRARDFEGFKVKKSVASTIAIGIKSMNIFSDIDIQYNRFKTSFGANIIFNFKNYNNHNLNLQYSLLRSFSIPIVYK